MGVAADNLEPVVVGDVQRDLGLRAEAATILGDLVAGRDGLTVNDPLQGGERVGLG